MDEIRDVYDLMLWADCAIKEGSEDSGCRARIDYQIIGLPLPEREGVRRRTEGKPVDEVPWMR